jgi:oxygen-independent coproporphyrinogen-3 oxidase
VKQKSRVEEFWKEYPERDPEYVRWYPPDFAPITPEAIWEPQDGENGTPQVAFYLHVPFCLSICKYCPFSKSVWSPERVARYVQAQKAEIALAGQLAYLKRAPLAAGYLGGGTPTALTTAQLADITSHLHDNFDIAAGAEMSIEANPDTVDGDNLLAIQRLGYNRISFGVQSFDDALLTRIGRTHCADLAQEVVTQALQMGFDNVGIDLIYGLPGQTIALWERDLNQAAKLGVHQVTTFGLYLPPGTVLYRETEAGKVGDYPDEAEKLAMYDLSQEILGASGYEQYTAYDFALPGKASLHHAINWQAPQGEYLGLGPGAFSHIHGHIFANVSSLDDYVTSVERGKLPVSKGRAIPRQEAMSRFMVLGVKYLSVSKPAFYEHFGVALDDHFGPVLSQLETWGLIAQNAEQVWVTEKGKTYLGNVSKAFYTPEQKGKPQPRV